MNASVPHLRPFVKRHLHLRVKTTPTFTTAPGDLQTIQEEDQMVLVEDGTEEFENKGGPAGGQALDLEGGGAGKAKKEG